MISRALRRLFLTSTALAMGTWVAAVTCGGPYVVSGSGPYFTIGAAVNALPTGAAITGNCIVDIQDSNFYSEPSSVTVQNIKISLGQIIIGPQSAANHPSVNTAVTGVPIFRIINASVTIQGLKILTGNNTYAIQASSPNVSISSVIVSSSATGAQGISLSSWSAVSYSTINAGSGSALSLAASIGTTITSCTITNSGSGVGSAALSIAGGSSNTVTQSFISNSGNGGYGMFLNASMGNVVTVSTFLSTGANGYAIYNNSGINDTFTGLNVTASGGGTGMAAEFASSINESVSQSTFSANSSRAIRRSSQGQWTLPMTIDCSVPFPASNTVSFFPA